MANIDQMRQDYKRIAPWLRTQGWTQEELGEIQASISVALALAEQGQPEGLESWAVWLADKAAELDALGELCRQAERRIRVAMERRKLKAA